VEVEDEEGGVEVEDNVELEGGLDETGKKKKNVATGTRGPRWKDLEDQYLWDSWKMVSIDAITGTNQKYGTYWARIKEE
jgi:hypothetical protein